MRLADARRNAPRQRLWLQQGAVPDYVRNMLGGRAFLMRADEFAGPTINKMKGSPGKRFYGSFFWGNSQNYADPNNGANHQSDEIPSPLWDPEFAWYSGKLAMTAGNTIGRGQTIYGCGDQDGGYDSAPPTWDTIAAIPSLADLYTLGPGGLTLLTRLPTPTEKAQAYYNSSPAILSAGSGPPSSTVLCTVQGGTVYSGSTSDTTLNIDFDATGAAVRAYGTPTAIGTYGFASIADYSAIPSSPASVTGPGVSGVTINPAGLAAPKRWFAPCLQSSRFAFFEGYAEVAFTAPDTVQGCCACAWFLGIEFPLKTELDWPEIPIGPVGSAGSRIPTNAWFTAHDQNTNQVMPSSAVAIPDIRTNVVKFGVHIRGDRVDFYADTTGSGIPTKVFTSPYRPEFSGPKHLMLEQWIGNGQFQTVWTPKPDPADVAPKRMIVRSVRFYGSPDLRLS